MPARSRRRPSGPSSPSPPTSAGGPSSKRPFAFAHPPFTRVRTLSVPTALSVAAPLSRRAPPPRPSTATSAPSSSTLQPEASQTRALASSVSPPHVTSTSKPKAAGKAAAAVPMTHRLLLVYTAPARGTIPADWCDHEHVPAHIGGAAPAVASCTRWAAADNKTPACLSLYDLHVAAPSAPASPACGAFAVNADVDSDATDSDSESRPSRVVPMSAPPDFTSYSKMGIGFDSAGSSSSSFDDTDDDADFVQTRVYAPRADRSRKDFPAEPHLSPSPTPGTRTPSPDTEVELDWRYIWVVECELSSRAAEAEFERWFDTEHVPLLARVPGWVRSRRFALSSVVSSSPSPSPLSRRRRWRLNNGEGACEYEYGMWEDGRGERPPKFLAVHEWSSLDAFASREFKRATSTPWRAEVLAENRVLRYDIRVYRAAEYGMDA